MLLAKWLRSWSDIVEPSCCQRLLSNAKRKVSRKRRDAGVSINLVYVATNTPLVFGADDPAAARQRSGSSQCPEMAA